MFEKSFIKLTMFYVIMSSVKEILFVRRPLTKDYGSFSFFIHPYHWVVRKCRFFLYQKSVEVWKDVSKTISFIKIGIHVQLPQGNQSLAKSWKEGILELLFPRKNKMKKGLEVIFNYQFLKYHFSTFWANFDRFVGVE